MTDRAEPGDRAEGEERLAGLHLRTGALLLARAELESLAARAAITGAALADLAEARWRTGDLEHAAESATAHLAAGGDRPIARLILVEAETAAGRPEVAGDHMTTLDGLPEAEIVALFAGMPHRANWPTLTSNAIDPRGPSEQSGKPGSGADTPGSPPSGASEPRPGGRRVTIAAFPEGDELLAQSREDMRSGEPERMATALDRLALALRMDPALAPAIVDLVTRRQEPAALLVRGDALRILGRLLEAEAAYAGAAAALERGTRDPS